MNEQEASRGKGINNLTKEQIQWFWEQCGMVYIKPFYKDGSANLPIDLNSLFKWAVPKAVSILKRNDHEFFGWKRLFDQWYPHISQRVDSALALFWAIYKAFGGNQ